MLCFIEKSISLSDVCPVYQQNGRRLFPNLSHRQNSPELNENAILLVVKVVRKMNM